MKNIIYSNTIYDLNYNFFQILILSLFQRFHNYDEYPIDKFINEIFFRF